jgi:hypothetical protein
MRDKRYLRLSGIWNSEVGMPESGSLFCNS